MWCCVPLLSDTRNRSTVKEENKISLSQIALLPFRSQLNHTHKERVLNCHWTWTHHHYQNTSVTFHQITTTPLLCITCIFLPNTKKIFTWKFEIAVPQLTFLLRDPKSVIWRHYPICSLPSQARYWLFYESFRWGPHRGTFVKTYTQRPYSPRQFPPTTHKKRALNLEVRRACKWPHHPYCPLASWTSCRYKLILKYHFDKAIIVK